MALTTGLQLPYGVQPVVALPTDTWSGPYIGVTEAVAIADANATIPSGVRFKSMEVRLIINGESKKYWYANGILDTDLEEFSAPIFNYVDTNFLNLTGGSINGSLSANGSLTVDGKIYGTIIDWMTLTRGYMTTPTLLGTATESGDGGDVYEYIFESSPSNITYYRFISTNGQRDEYYANYITGTLSNLIVKKKIIL